MLLGATDVDKLAGFVGYVKSNMAREANRIVDWSEKYWGRRGVRSRFRTKWEPGSIGSGTFSATAQKRT
jgi:hypothetical protein